MKTLITGATGYVGVNLVKRLLASKHSIRALVRPKSNYIPLKKLGCRICFGDITQKNSIEPAVQNVDVIYHLAATFRTARISKQTYWETNVKGTQNMLECALAAGVKRFIHCSTIGVHGNVEDPPGNENSPFNPGDIYQVTKVEGEKLALKYQKEKGLPVIIIRPAGIYGPGDIRFLKLFQAINKRKFLMIGSGRTLWHPVYIDDLITGFELASQKDGIIGETFIIGGPEYLRLRELVNIIANALDVPPPPKFFIPAWPVQTLGAICEFICRPLKIEPPIYRRRIDFFSKNRAFNISKARNLLGYSPKHDINTGVKLTADWYRAKGLL